LRDGNISTGAGRMEEDGRSTDRPDGPASTNRTSGINPAVGGSKGKPVAMAVDADDDDSVDTVSGAAAATAAAADVDNENEDEEGDEENDDDDEDLAMAAAMMRQLGAAPGAPGSN
jgi:hypothetical protein